MSVILSLGYPLAGIGGWVGRSSIGATKGVYGHMDCKPKVDMAKELSGKIGSSFDINPEPCLRTRQLTKPIKKKIQS